MTKDKHKLLVSTEIDEENAPKHSKESFGVLDSSIDVEDAENLQFLSSEEVDVSTSQKE